MGKAEEVEGGPIRFRMTRALCRLWAEIDEACLVGMEREPKSCKTLAQDCQDALGVDDVVERHDRIVGEPGKGAFPFEARPHLGFEPFVQHIVQKDVREAGRDHAPLRGTPNLRTDVAVRVICCSAIPLAMWIFQLRGTNLACGPSRIGGGRWQIWELDISATNG